MGCKSEQVMTYSKAIAKKAMEKVQVTKQQPEASSLLEWSSTSGSARRRYERHGTDCTLTGQEPNGGCASTCARSQVALAFPRAGRKGR